MLCQLFSNSITSPRPQGLCLLCSLLEMGLQCIFCWKKECTNKNTPGSLASRGFGLYWLKLSQSIWLVFCRLTSGLLSSTYYFLEFSLHMLWMESYWREASSFNKGFLYSPALLELAAVLQPHPPKFWNYRNASLCLAKRNAEGNSEG